MKKKVTKKPMLAKQHNKVEEDLEIDFKYIDDLKPGAKFTLYDDDDFDDDEETKPATYMLLDSKEERPGKECWVVNLDTAELKFFGYRGNNAEWRHVDEIDIEEVK